MYAIYGNMDPYFTIFCTPFMLALIYQHHGSVMGIGLAECGTQALHGKGARRNRGAVAFAGRALQGPGFSGGLNPKKLGYMER